MKTIFTLIVCFITFSLSAQITPSSQWTWMKGDKIISQSGVYGVQGIPNILNKPGARFNSSTWKDVNGNLWLFGGFGYSQSGNGFLNDLWKYDPSTNQWTWKKGDNFNDFLGVYGTLGVSASTNKPGSRYGSISWTDASGNFWLFGGSGYASTGNGVLNDLWKYDPSTNQWTWINGDNTINQLGIYGTQGVSSSANKPGARYTSISWIDGLGNLWLFGGNGFAAAGSASFLNDLWKYDPTINQWTWVKGDNTTNQLGVYGTQGVSSTANKPGARYTSVPWIDGSNNLWLFGGWGYAVSGGFGNLNDLWKYNLSTNQWTWMKGPNLADQAGVYGVQGVSNAANIPYCRSGSISWSDASFFWLFGGNGIYGGGDDFNDLWKYDPLSNEWTWIKGNNGTDQAGVYGTQGVSAATNNPGGRSLHISWTDGGGNFWLFGGGGWDGVSNEGYLNDLWKLSYAPIPVTLSSLKAFQLSSGINVQWTFSQEIDMDRYEVEKSPIGNGQWTMGNSQPSTGNHSSSYTYNWFDANPNRGANFYRIKMIGKDGKESYSQIVKVVIGRGASISVYPNPVTNNSFALQFNDVPKGNYDIRIMNSAGQVVYKSVINHKGGSGTQTIQLPLLLAKGLYNLEVVGADGKMSVEKVVVQ